jgi:hypothetical protein
MTDFNLDHLKHFRFTELFNELGWDLPAQQQPYIVAVGDDTFSLDVVADKRSVQVLQCRPDAAGRIPDYATRQKIERKVTVDVREHLIVFTDAARTTQVWQWVSRDRDQPNQYREITWHKGDQPELLRQKLRAIAFTLADEESLTVLGVIHKLGKGFPRDKVTKKFYAEFDKQRKAFTDFIEGIPKIGKEIAEDQRWYTAVLIDRLMFLWFLQEKLFLDGKKEYLQLRLGQHLADSKKDSPSFYRAFLCPLFFRGFAEARTDANRATIKAEFGDVPYLNGGLFARHQLETKYGEALDVADAAFEKLFAFFNGWDWHLDDRPLAKGNEVNPDVLGYIFEKFVNQKQMGAYYTKEDITEYIGKNTILPCLLAKVRAEHPGAFDALAWPLLQQSGDAYIYPAMLKGVDQPYPAEIAAGLDAEAPNLLERRKPWNKRADDTLSLPTEIWRETIARHQRTREVRAKIASGDLRDVGDLITYNLNIRQFVQDLIERCTHVALLKSFWFNLAGRLPRKSNEKFRHGLSVLDPTCGSGAFLFAALNILKPLYDATLRTLHAVRNDALIAGEKSSPEKWAEVDEILTRFATEKTDRAQSYAVIKHIIVNNLYGVDIEEQATEIAKLRLFLKLVALLEPGDDIEPLPDIDFNIRHGNTLVGYATEDETRKAVLGVGTRAQPKSGNLFDDAWEDIRLRLIAVAQQYNNFQIQQVQRGGHVSPADKQALDNTLHDLEETLSYHLAKEYGVNPKLATNYEAWKASHQPFHWFVDFYPLMMSGGFDAVIGNPPYISAAKVRKAYVVRNYETAEASDIYAWCLERIARLVSRRGSTGMIVPLSLGFSRDFATLRQLLIREYSGNWFSSFARIPAALFAADVRVRNVIHIGSNSTATRSLPKTTRLHRWFEEYRPHLMEAISYAYFNPDCWRGRIPKIGSQSLLNEFERLLADGTVNVNAAAQDHPSPHVLYFKKSAYNWLSFGREHAPCFDEMGAPIVQAEYGATFFRSKSAADAALLLLNGKLQFAFWVAIGDDFHVTHWMFGELPVDIERLVSKLGEGIGAQSDALWLAMQRETTFKLNAGKRVGNFNLARLRSVTDDSDVSMARALDVEHVWQEVELVYTQTVRTTIDDGDD